MVPVQVVAHGGKMHKRDRSRGQTLAAWCFLGPSLAGFAVFTLVPICSSLVLSFFSWNLSTPPVFAGLGNFAKLLAKDALFRTVLMNTAYYTVLVIPIGLTLSFLVAVLLNKEIAGRDVYRALFFMPSITTIVSVAMIWQWMYNNEFGVINYLLWKLGVDPIPWLTDTAWAMPAIAIVTTWHGFGYHMVIFLAGLQGIPRQLYEVADIDGANSMQKLLHITVPMMTPILFFVLVMAIINTFQVFDIVFIMTGGGPAGVTRTLVQYLYSNGFVQFKMGYASAIALCLFVLLFSVTVLQMRLQRKWVVY